MYHSISMVDMAKTPSEIKDEMPTEAAPPESYINRYPYGLCISLDDEMLKKLDLEKPDAGDMIHLFAMATVTSVSENQMAGGEKCCRVELQITHLGLENENEEDAEETE